MMTALLNNFRPKKISINQYFFLSCPTGTSFYPQVVTVVATKELSHTLAEEDALNVSAVALNEYKPFKTSLHWMLAKQMYVFTTQTLTSQTSTSPSF